LTITPKLDHKAPFICKTQLHQIIIKKFQITQSWLRFHHTNSWINLPHYYAYKFQSINLKIRFLKAEKYIKNSLGNFNRNPVDQRLQIWRKTSQIVWMKKKKKLTIWKTNLPRINRSRETLYCMKLRWKIQSWNKAER